MPGARFCENFPPDSCLHIFTPTAAVSVSLLLLLFNVYFMFLLSVVAEGAAQWAT